MIPILQKALSLLQHPWAPAVAVGLLALLLCLARCARGRGKALDGGRTFAVFIILSMLAVIVAALIITWLTWGSSNPSIYYLVTIAGIFVAAAVGIATIAFAWNQNKSEPTLTIEQYKKDLLEQHGNYFLEKQKREEIERKLANLEESYQEKLRLLEDSKEKLQQIAGNLPKQQLAEAEERLAQGDTELAEQLFDRVAAETGQTAAAALLQSGRLAEDRLDYSKALRNYAAAVALAPDNPDYLLPAGQMARTMGDYQQAEEWLAHLLAIREQEDKEDVELALVLNELALVYKTQNRYEEAKTLNKRSLKIREQYLGKEHPEVAESLNDLGELYIEQGRYEDAEPLCKRSLDIREKKLGKEHSDVAQSLNSLAWLYRQQGGYAESEPLYKQSLEILENKLGKEHPNVAASLNNLALLYESKHRYSESEPLYKQSLEILENKLGKEHPGVARSMNNLALLYESQSRYEEAKPLYQRALAILKATFPNGHPDINAVQANYNTLKEKMQKR